MKNEHLCLEQSCLDILDRYSAAQSLDKKHLQRKHFIDLLHFLRDAGLNSHSPPPNQLPEDFFPDLKALKALDGFNLDEVVQRLDFYLFKNLELNQLLSASFECHPDLKNKDIEVMKGFSNSMSIYTQQIAGLVNSLVTIEKEVSSWAGKFRESSTDQILKYDSEVNSNIQTMIEMLDKANIKEVWFSK